jgi:hypothetical protein
MSGKRWGWGGEGLGFKTGSERNNNKNQRKLGVNAAQPPLKRKVLFM